MEMMSQHSVTENRAFRRNY